MTWRANSSLEQAPRSRAMSLVEAGADVAVGYGVAVGAQILILPVYGLHAELAQSLRIAAAVAAASIARSFALRQMFEAIRVKGAE